MENTLSIPVALLAQGSIRIDGITYYRHGNKVRACKSRRSPKKTRTEGEEESSSRFTEARKMWRIYRRAIGDLPIWKLMAKEMGINKSDSLFHSQNGGCFRPGEGVWAFPTFRFSTGTLDAPVITSVTREGWSVTLNWENDIDCPKASVSDQVYVGYFYGTLPWTSRQRNNRKGHPCISTCFSAIKIPPVSLQACTRECNVHAALLPPKKLKTKRT